MKHSRKLLAPVLIAFSLGLMVAAPASAQTAGGILRAGMQADPVGLDPHVTDATSTRNQLENVYDTLVAFDSAGKIVPSLAGQQGQPDVDVQAAERREIPQRTRAGGQRRGVFHQPHQRPGHQVAPQRRL